MDSDPDEMKKANILSMEFIFKLVMIVTRTYCTIAYFYDVLK